MTQPKPKQRKLPTVEQTLRRVGACARWREWAEGRDWENTFADIREGWLQGPKGECGTVRVVDAEMLSGWIINPLRLRAAGYRRYSVEEGRVFERYRKQSRRYAATWTFRQFSNLLLKPKGTRA